MDSDLRSLIRALQTPELLEIFNRYLQETDLRLFSRKNGGLVRCESCGDICQMILREPGDLTNQDLPPGWEELTTISHEGDLEIDFTASYCQKCSSKIRNDPSLVWTLPLPEDPDRDPRPYLNVP